MHAHTKVGLAILATFVILFAMVFEGEGALARRWAPVFGLAILGYIIYSSVKLWNHEKRQSERDAWMRQQREAKEAEAKRSSKRKKGT